MQLQSGVCGHKRVQSRDGTPSASCSFPHPPSFQTSSRTLFANANHPLQTSEPPGLWERMWPCPREACLRPRSAGGAPRRPWQACLWLGWGRPHGVRALEAGGASPAVWAGSRVSFVRVHAGSSPGRTTRREGASPSPPAPALGRQLVRPGPILTRRPGCSGAIIGH